MGQSKHLDELLARLLSVGTWAACGLILLGLAVPQPAGDPGFLGPHLVALGTLLLIALPVTRVVVMAVWFLKNREGSFALIASIVLLIIVVSAVVGARMATVS